MEPCPAKMIISKPGYFTISVEVMCYFFIPPEEGMYHFLHPLEGVGGGLEVF
jgi:hypothetical protein